jgi:hypothetical protein
MIIVDERGFLIPQLEDKGFNVFDFFDGHQLLDVKHFCSLPLQRRAEILLVDTQSLLNHPELQENFKILINTFLGVVFFHEQQNQKALSWVQDQAAFLTKIVGEYAIPMPQLQWTMLSNQLQFFWDVLEQQKTLQKQLVGFSVELDHAIQSAELEMAKAKKIHEVLIPKRRDEIKGVQFLNKYAAGDGGGGEFFDLHQSNNKVFQILVTSQSYLISSSILGLLGQHKLKEFSPIDFLKEAGEEINTVNSAKKKKAEVEVTILELDLSLLSLKAYGWGQVEFFSHLKGKVSLGLPALRGGESAQSTYQLERGEKFVVFSQGFLFNWKESHNKEDLYHFVKSHRDLALQELLMELFFQLRHEKTSEFLKKDATVVMMEVNRHGMHQV